jgi:uncharacterized YigZ family protein
MSLQPPDRYRSLNDGPLQELRVKGSRFLALAWRLDSESEALGRLEPLHRRYHDATHHCWALRCGPPESCAERHEDDGEPSGTAGLPILGALRRAEVCDAMVVVVRYFGGTKLGTGGLVRAYGEAAALAVEAAPVREILRTARLALACHYHDLGTVEAVLARLGGDIVDVSRDYAAEPRIEVEVVRSRAGGLRAAVVEATAGRGIVSVPEDGRS